jgi:hypothetical protein
MISSRAIAFWSSALSVAACSGSPSSITQSGQTVPDFSTGLVLSGACVSATFAPTRAALAIEVLMDQSTSMSDPVAGGDTKWGAVSGAIGSFVKSPSSAGVSMAIQYFGLPTSVSTTGGVVDSCNVADYAKPDVDFGELPRIGAAVVSSLNAHGPSTTTPTQPALQGAIEHAREWGASHPDEVPAIIIATDGEPYACGSTVPGTEAIAAQGAVGSPRILTFVIGIGDQGAALDGIAQAGGTDRAFYIDTNGQVGEEFLAALAAVRGSAHLGCTYGIPTPDAGTADLTEVNVTIGPTGQQNGRAVIGNVAGPDACASTRAGWFFQPAANPSTIQLCPNTCTAVANDRTGSTLQIALGCKTQPAVTQ